MISELESDIIADRTDIQINKEIIQFKFDVIVVWGMFKITFIVLEQLFLWQLILSVKDEFNVYLLCEKHVVDLILWP